MSVDRWVLYVVFHVMGGEVLILIRGGCWDERALVLGK